MELRDAHVVVTGGSRGIGRAIAAEAVSRGARVTLVARDATRLADAAREVGADRHVAVDLAADGSVADLVDALAEGPPVDVLVNNAGVDRTGPFLDASPGAIRDTYAVNTVAPVLLARALLPGMLERGRGHVVNVSSLAWAVGFGGMSLYASSKAALSRWHHLIEMELDGLGVGFTLVELGPVPSDMLTTVQGYGPTGAAFRRVYRLRLTADTSPETVARAVADAVERGRRRVRLPRRSAPFGALAEVPQRVARLLLTGVPVR